MAGIAQAGVAWAGMARRQARRAARWALRRPPAHLGWRRVDGEVSDESGELTGSTGTITTSAVEVTTSAVEVTTSAVEVKIALSRFKFAVGVGRLQSIRAAESHRV